MFASACYGSALAFVYKYGMVNPRLQGSAADKRPCIWSSS